MNINPDFNKILAEALDSWDKICEEQAKANDRLLFDEMLSKGQIKPPVIVCSRAIKKQIEAVLPGVFCLLGTDCCEDDKAYMVTDEATAEIIRQALLLEKEKLELTIKVCIIKVQEMDNLMNFQSTIKTYIH